LKSQFLKFLLTGGVAALANLLSRRLFSQAVAFEWAVALAYLVGLLTAYSLARLFVFERSGRSVASELGRFALVNFFAFCLVWVISVGLARIAFPAIQFNWHPEDVAHFIGVLAPAVTSYFAHRYYSFGRETSGA
jgi:putative flippase GtrA